VRRTLTLSDERLRQRVSARREWLAQHPEAALRLEYLESESDGLERLMDPHGRGLERPLTPEPRQRSWERTLARAVELDGPDFGVGL
jgi:hypothetical protein